MSTDSALNQIIQYGTTANRLAFTPAPASGSKLLYIWFDSDNSPNTYVWNGAAWVQINVGGGGTTTNIYNSIIAMLENDFSEINIPIPGVTGATGPQGIPGSGMVPTNDEGPADDVGNLIVTPDIKFGADGTVYWSDGLNAYWTGSPRLNTLLKIDGNPGGGYAAGGQLLLKNTAGDYTTFIGTNANSVIVAGRGSTDGLEVYFGSASLFVTIKGDGSHNVISSTGQALRIVELYELISSGNTPLLITGDDSAGGTNGIILNRSNRTSQGNNAITVWQYNNTTEVARMTSDGKLGLGTNAPSAQIDATSTVRFRNYPSGLLSTDASGNLVVVQAGQLIPVTGLLPSVDVDGDDGPRITKVPIHGSDLILSDTTINDVSSSSHGFAPKSPADATKFLNGAATPAYAQVKDSDLSTSDITTNDASTSKHGFRAKLTNVLLSFQDETGVVRSAPTSLFTGTLGGSTGATSETNLAAIKIPAGTMGANGSVEIKAYWRWTGAAGNRTLSYRFSTSSGDTSGGFQFVSTSFSSSNLSTYSSKTIFNQNSASAQATGGLTLLGDLGNNTNDRITGAINTANDAYVNLNASLTSGDTAFLIGVRILVTYGA